MLLMHTLVAISKLAVGVVSPALQLPNVGFRNNSASVCITCKDMVHEEHEEEEEEE